MLTKFRHIKNFAVFKECDWDTSIRDKGNNIATLKKLNIIYGRNYSGKTSLSRIIRSLETGVKHPKYLDSSYEFSHTNGGSLSDKNLSACPYTVRVYNKDFLDENLKWLSNPDGSIKPFTILGEKNIEIENEIAKNEKMLGSIKEKIGLHWDSFCKASEHRELEDKIQRKKRELDDKLREKANTDIKQNPIYRNINYNIGTIKSDIATIGIDKASILSAEQKSELTLSLTEESKDIIDFQLSIDNKLPIYRNAAADLLGRKINPTHITQELLEDPLLKNGLGTDWLIISIRKTVSSAETLLPPRCGKN